MKIILDTNFLIAVAQFKIDIFRELKGHELYLILPVVIELNKISRGKSKDARSAKLARILLKAQNLKTLKPNETSADKALIEYSKKGYAVATQDIALKEKLEEQGAKVIYIRQKKYVII